MYRSLIVAIRAFHQVIERFSTGQLLVPAPEGVFDVEVCDWRESR
jgi:hypothetical protein